MSKQAIRSSMSAETGNEDVVFRAHWSLFVPTVIIAALYLGVWVVLAASGSSDSALARLALIVGVIAPPLLFVMAWLRYQSVRVTIQSGGVLIRGGPGADWQAVAWDEIAVVNIRRGLAGRLLPTGTLVIIRTDGSTLSVRDVANAQVAMELITARSQTS